MTKEEILIAFKEGRLSAQEVQTRLREGQYLRSPLSEGQKGLWMLHQMAPRMSAYNIPLCFRIMQPLEIEKFKRACSFLLEQYPVLNTVIVPEDGVPYQVVRDAPTFGFETEDSVNLSAGETLAYLRKKVREPFSLQQGPLLRVHILRRSGPEFIILMVIHHLVFDGYSIRWLLTTLFDAYQNLMQGREPKAVRLQASYPDFVLGEQQMLAGAAGEEHRSYWLKQLTGALPVLELPADYPRQTAPSFAGQVYSETISGELSQELKSFAVTHRINPAVLFLAIYQLLLHKYTGQDDLVVGMPTLGRHQERFDDLIGYFINMLPIRSQIGNNPTFLEMLRQVELRVIEGMDHAEYPFASMVKALNVPRLPGIPPVFQVSYLYQNFVQSSVLQQFQERYGKTVKFEFMEGLYQEGEYELELEVYERESAFSLNLKYNPELYHEATARRMMEHYLTLATAVLQDPDRSLSEYSLLSSGEENTLLIEWNATREDYPADQCFHQLFEVQARKTPQATAVACQDRSLTFQELDQLSTGLAIYLQTLGVGPDRRVALCVERSADLIIGLLGIVKAGGAYVPLDYSYPEERLSYMLRDSGGDLVITQAGFEERLKRLSGAAAKIIALDRDWPAIAKAAGEQKDYRREARPDHLAYVIYTSGSTGRPKGVMIPHRALTNFLEAMGNILGFASGDKILAITTYCFDIAGLELYLPLVRGAQTYICSTATGKDAEKLIRTVNEQKPTFMQATPATWTMLFQAGWKNETKTKLLCGGEALPETLKQYFIETGSRAWNVFGPTETTIWSTVAPIVKDEPVTIGKPIANTQIYILDKYLKPVPIGVPGELCIAGDGLARGYLNQPGLTAERFIENPFHSGTKLYRTGDLARWLPDGNIGFLGRTDYQVKIRGYRIELNEIESQLASHPGIRETVVIVKETGGHKQLIAFYTPKGRGKERDAAPDSLTPTALRAYLQSKLPGYMVPAFLIEVAKLPLTPNGKVDRRALAGLAQDLNRPAAAGNQSATEAEAALVKIWREVLGNSRIGTEDGFFEAGGDSLLAVTVAQRIKEHFHSDFTVTDLFKYPNIKAISAYLADRQSAADELPAGPANLAAVESGKDRQPATLSAPRSAYPGYYEDSLAIIGISCQFPGAANHFEFWNNLREGVESIKLFTSEELSRLGVPAAIRENPHYVPVQAKIEGKEHFDPEFFNIAPRDAELMDPQFRLLLLHSWKAFEDAGYIPKQLPATSVFMSASNNLYRQLSPGAAAGAGGVMRNSEEYVSWVLSQGGTIATLISHKLGLKGPSFFVHSNCSSSLTGLYAACQSLRSREADSALVGAATIFASANTGYLHQPGLNFSSDGHVKAFAANADGMVGGEGVAVILVKRALDAIAAGDPIYALVRGIAVNNDGADKVGFYAPGARGQAEVIQKALDKTGIHPESVGYIETHGTGTKLGDPVEFSALRDVYRRYTTKTQFCGIGSVKTNIGHLDTAAGLAGLIKIALSLRRREIPPSLNCQTVNPAMDWSNSPFFLVDRLTGWDQAPEPHRAGLSSFGIGGTNSHVILEEYQTEGEGLTPAPDSSGAARERIVPLSAKNAERLRDYGRELYDFLKSPPGSRVNLDDLAYTFQVGREAMASRAVFIARHSRELIEKLAAFINGPEAPAAGLGGAANAAEGMVELFAQDANCREVVRKWCQQGELSKIGELWAKGLQIDWELLYPDAAKPRRVNLPTYPFAKQSYWIPPEHGAAADPAGAVPLHPLLHRNTSTLEGFQFSSTFSGKEFFLKDHLVRGVPVLPGVATLEMARAAVERIAGPGRTETREICLRNIVWAQPVVAGDQPVEVSIRLVPEGRDQIAYRIYAQPGAQGEAGPVLCSQGRAMMHERSAAPVVDLKALLQHCKEGALSSEQLYRFSREKLVDYGPGYRGVKAVLIGSDHILAKLSLPDAVTDSGKAYVLHPSIMDSAVQASAVLMGETDVSGQPGGKDAIGITLPFALDELQIFSGCSGRMWALIRRSDAPGAAKIKKSDIILCDLQGKVCVRMNGFSWRTVPYQIPAANVPGREDLSPQTGSRTVMLTPVWDVQAADRAPKFPPSTANTAIIGGSRRTVAALRQFYPNATVIELQPDDAPETVAQHLTVDTPWDQIFWIAPQRQDAVSEDGQPTGEPNQAPVGVFRLVKSLLRLGYAGRSLNWTFITTQAQPVRKGERTNPAWAGLHGLVGSVAKEYPNWKIRLFDLEPGGEWPIADMLALPPDPWGNAWVYRNREWYRQKLVPLAPLPAREGTGYRSGGVYVVIGGAGGLGEVWSEYLIRTYQARIIWIGRREIDPVIQSKLDRLAKLGEAPVYISADAADGQALGRAYLEIKQKFPVIHGIVHAAMVLADKSLANMEEEQFQRVLRAKTDTALRMAQVFAGEPLDLVLFFSSLNSFIKAPGQSNYNSGCAFVDAYARQLARQLPAAVKVINWGYWGSVGGVTADGYRERMEQLGIGSIEPREAMETLETLLAGALDQILLVKITKPSALGGISTQESLGVYPDETGPCLPRLQARDYGDPRRLAALQQAASAAGPFEKRLYRLLLSQLQLLGLLDTPRSKRAEVLTEHRLTGIYSRWVEESILLLTEQDMVKAAGTTWSVTDGGSGAEEALWREWEESKADWMADPGLKAQVELVETTLRALPEVLTGKRPATDVIFPNSSLDLVEGVYQNNVAADYFNEILADTVAAYLEERRKQNPAGRIRILEIGAGTGATSAVVFRKIAAYREMIREYLYTDISKAFLLHAEREYGGENPYLTYQVLDINAPVGPQGIEAAAYDIVIAANVLHATKNIRQTLRNTKAALKKNGLLILNELSRKILFSHLTFGLLEGWWLYEDPRLRLAGSPGLSPAAWQKVLESEGFADLFFPAASAHELGQQIIVAASDGLIRAQAPDYLTSPAAGSLLKPETPARKGKFPDFSLRPRLATADGSPPYAALDPGGSAATEAVRRIIRELVATAVKMDDRAINDERSFAEYGVDSIIAVDLVNSLNRQFQADLATPTLFDYNNVNQLTKYIVSQYREMVDVPAPAAASRLPETVTERRQTGDNRGLTPAASESHRRTAAYVERVVRECVAQAVKMDAAALQPERSFAEYGVDSIIAVNLINNIGDRLQVSLATTLLFDYNNLKQLTGYLVSEYPANLTGRHRDERISGPDQSGEVQDGPGALNGQWGPEPESHPDSGGAEPWDGLPVVGSSTVSFREEQGETLLREPVAIIGMSGRFPGSNTVDELWEHLARGTELITEATRWDLEREFAGLAQPGSVYCKNGGFLEDIAKFDPIFFNISGLEAKYMDPRQRLFLEESWKALEDAGYAGIGDEGRQWGVYVGCGRTDYDNLFETAPPPQSFWGNDVSIVPARIAYFLNLQGPAVTIDTACSSSLVAIHQACQSLWTREIELAIAGGVYINCTPGIYLLGNRAEMLSATGHCYAFDERADGFVPGEGVGAVVLKRLKDALADGDHIYGVIRGTGINQDGRTNGITAPSARSQERLERYIYDTFQLNPERIQMVEAHGTGTKLGDPIEFNALTQAFRAYTDRKQYCAMGSIKTNLGHAAHAAGIAAVIKILLSLKHKQIPPSLNFETGNSHIRFESSPFFVNTELRDWNNRTDSKRLAVVSSFGFSGTNAHLAIEEAPQSGRKHPERPAYLIVLSARNREQLRRQAEQLRGFCEKNPGADCGNISFTLLTGRKHFNHRLACIVNHPAQLGDYLRQWLSTGPKAPVYCGEINEREQREELAIKQDGDQCVQNCANSDGTADYRDSLATIAQLYVKGYSLEFERLFAGGGYSRLSLPTYPFAGERYWAPRTAGPAENLRKPAAPPAQSVLMQPPPESGGSRTIHPGDGAGGILAKIIGARGKDGKTGA